MTRMLDDEAVAALEAEKRLLDEMLELTKKVDFTEADQNRLNELVAERQELLATEARQGGWPTRK